MDIYFTVPGTPVGKGRPKFSRRGNFTTTYTPEKTVNFENLVKLSFMQAGCEKLSGPLSAHITACFPIPKSASKKMHRQMADGYALHTKRPDADNIAKSVLDALNDVAFDDDSQVAALSVVKRFSETPQTMVYIHEMRKEDGDAD